MTSQFSDMTSLSSSFDKRFLFLLSSLVTGPTFRSITSLVLELWQFSFIRDRPEIRKLEIPRLKFCQISGDWDELGIPNSEGKLLIKFFWILQNARLRAFTVSKLLKENQLEGFPPLRPSPPPPPSPPLPPAPSLHARQTHTQIRVKRLS